MVILNIFALAGFSLDFKGSILLLIALAALGIGWAALAYRRTLPPTRTALRIVLGMLRGLALLLLIFLIFEPAISLRQERQLKPLLAIIFDDSQSLKNKDASGLRSQQLARLVSNPAWGQLRQKFDLEIFAAGDSLRQMGSLAFDSLRLNAIGTDLSRAWERAQQREEGQDFAAIVLVSDGGDNTGRDPLKAAAAVKIPIYTVGVGDTARVQDASIVSLMGDEVAYCGKETELTIRIKARGLEGQPAALELTDSDNRTLAKQNLRLPPDDLEAEAVLKFIPERIGRLPITARLILSAKEWSTENNTRSFPLEVKKSRIRVLMVSGQPSFESMFLQQAIARLEDFELLPITFKQTGEVFSAQIESLDEAFARANVLLLINCLQQDTPAAARERLRRASAQHPLPIWIWAGSRMSAESLKTLIGDMPFSLINAPSSGEGQAAPVRFYVELDPDAELSESGLWNDLPPLTTPEFPVKLAASAQTLIALKDAETGATLGPALISWESGERRFAAAFGAGYWKWGFLSVGMGSSDELYLNFVRRVLRWLAASPESRPLRITPDQDLYAAGEAVHFDARVLGADGRSISSAQVEMTLQGPDGSEKILLEVDPAGRYAGRFRPEAVGTYSYEGVAMVGADTLGADSGSFMVEAYNVEKETLTQNRALLEGIATASGGVYFPADSLAKLANAISAPPRLVTVGWSRRFFLNWDVWAVLIGLLALEWIIRKRRGML